MTVAATLTVDRCCEQGGRVPRAQVDHARAVRRRRRDGVPVPHRHDQPARAPGLQDCRPLDRWHRGRSRLTRGRPARRARGVRPRSRPLPFCIHCGKYIYTSLGFPSASLYAALRASLNLPCVPLLLAGAVTMYCAPQRVRELLCTPSACVWLCRWLALASRVVVAHSEDEEEKQAALCRVLRLETMVAAREAVEEQEAVRRPHLTCALGCFCAALTVASPTGKTVGAYPRQDRLKGPI